MIKYDVQSKYNFEHVERTYLIYNIYLFIFNFTQKVWFVVQLHFEKKPSNSAYWTHIVVNFYIGSTQ